jgi:hypothetical protein
MSRTRHCSFCQGTNHNIRTCDRYISDIHKEYLNVYVHHPTLDWTVNDTQLNNRQIRLLAIKAGFRPIRVGNEFTAHYLEAFHRHYIQLANAERQRLRDVRNEAFLQSRPRTVRQLPGYMLDMQTLDNPVPVPARIYIPNYNQVVPVGGTPVGVPAASTASTEVLRFGDSRNLREDIMHFAQENNIQPVSVVRNLMQELMELGPVETPRNATSVLLHIDASKFPTDIASCECPICYETSDKMAVTKCGHVYCQPCINKWMQAKQNPSCAVCRSSIRDIYLDNENNLDHMLHL